MQGEGDGVDWGRSESNLVIRAQCTEIVAIWGILVLIYNWVMSDLRKVRCKDGKEHFRGHQVWSWLGLQLHNTCLLLLYICICLFQISCSFWTVNSSRVRMWDLNLIWAASTKGASMSNLEQVLPFDQVLTAVPILRLLVRTWRPLSADWPK